MLGFFCGGVGEKYMEVAYVSTLGRCDGQVMCVDGLDCMSNVRVAGIY